MRIPNRFVQVEIEHGPGNVIERATLRFPLTEAKITLTGDEVWNLWRALDYIYGNN